ncbi:hypothetical protein [Thioalkalivibrio sp. ALE20]|uniref:hypothetical protein n=1 Tax=Thioalkalivibrio sp. ALE20 TaxID=545275 RepID=UPI0003790A57|nr:hypothetical protein [Thioalkalivibrio sp. ALE20]
MEWLLVLLLGGGIMAANHDPEPTEPTVAIKPIPAPPADEENCLAIVEDLERVEGRLTSDWSERVYWIEGEACER